MCRGWLKWGSCSQCSEVIITDHRGRTLSLSGAAPPRPGPCLLLSKHSVSSPAPPAPHLSTDQLAAAGLRDHQQSATCGASPRHFITNTSIMNCSFGVSINMLYFRTIKWCCRQALSIKFWIESGSTHIFVNKEHCKLINWKCGQKYCSTLDLWLMICFGCENSPISRRRT